MKGLTRRDVEEKRVKCDICGFELLYPEFLLFGNKCVFHTEDLLPLRQMTFFSYIRMFWMELLLAKKKILMKDRGMTEIDWQACVGTVAEDLQYIGKPADFQKLVEAVKNHGIGSKGVAHDD